MSKMSAFNTESIAYLLSTCIFLTTDELLQGSKAVQLVRLRASELLPVFKDVPIYECVKIRIWKMSTQVESQLIQ